MIIRKGYSDGPEGQLHWRMAVPKDTPTEPDLYCFSPGPFSSIAYADMLPKLATQRRVIAADYPGQGGSDGGGGTPSIETYAASMLAVMKHLSGDAEVHVTGFHSGTLVAVETALQSSSQVSRIVLVDVPAFDPDTRAKYLPAVGAPFEPSADLESLSKAWDMAVIKRQASQSLDACLQLFADTVANGSQMNATFHAAFSYDVEAKFAASVQPTAIIATQSGLLEPTRRAAQLIEGSRLTERLDIEGSVLNKNAAATAEAILLDLAEL